MDGYYNRIGQNVLYKDNGVLKSNQHFIEI